MKNKHIISLILGLTIFVVPVFSSAQVESVDNGYPEKVDTFTSMVRLQDDGTALVQENILYDFGTNKKHGLYRVIPTLYKPRVGNPHQSVSNVKVTNDTGVEYPVQTDTSALTSVAIMVGDPDKLISGKQRYIVSYKVNRVISSLNDGDQFNWNIIGDGWGIPIGNISVSLIMSDSFAAKLSDVRCYAGAFGTNTACTSNSYKTSKDNVIVFSQNTLASNQALTLVADFAKGTFASPSSSEVFFWEKPWYLAFPVLIFLAYFTLWFLKGRDPSGRGTIVPEYEAPEGITPLEASYLLTNNMSNKSVSAQMIYLATKGHLKIKRIEGKGLFAKANYEFELVKDVDRTPYLGSSKEALANMNAKKFDIMNAAKGFFGVNYKTNDLTMDQASMNFVFGGGTTSSIETIQADILENMLMLRRTVVRSLREKDYYKESPGLVVGIYIAIAIAVYVPVIILAAYMFWDWWGWVALFVSAIFVIIFSVLMPKRTKAGSEMRERILGLKMYINYAEKDRIKFHNEPKKDPKKFEELLPYAMIFGLEKEWAKQFEDIYKAKPDWYVGNAYFTPILLTNEISVFSDFTTSAMMSSTAGSIGGGFAGGGGGGGGGGSW